MASYGFTIYRDAVRDGAPTGDESSRAARVRALRGGEPRRDGAYVLYWMQMYLRGSGNAALDEAVRRANRFGLPLLVYQGLSPDYPEANDRIHTFILECARDVARELAERGIAYRFHLRRSAANDPEPVAVRLAEQAACVVVDDFPAFILPGVTRALVDRTADSGVPVYAVDANGLVPLGAIPDRQYAAYTIRPRLHARLPEYLVPDPETELVHATAPDVRVPENRFIDPGGLDDEDLAALIADCTIDHAVRPSPRYPGGRRQALRRLRSFIDERLDDYAELRNDPGHRATSGLSPYLHFGCLSTGEIMREVLAVEAHGESVDAFLEELVVRRELAYNFCRYTPVGQHTALSALPDWAQKTLAEHADDERRELYSELELEAGETDEPIESVAAAYESGFHQALQHLPSIGRHTNVLQHLAGYVSDAIDDGDRAELTEAIHGYRSGLVPLIVPVVLLRHYVRRLEVDYLADQVYLQPHPHELMLLNHV